jgi:hypothetical protein
MSYLDSFSGYNKLYKPPKSVTIGSNTISSPTQISLDNMYGSSQASSFEIPQVTVSPYTQQVPQQPSVLDVNDEYLQGQGWVKKDGQWLPGTAEEGQTYEGANGKRYVFSNGEWIPWEEAWFGPPTPTIGYGAHGVQTNIIYNDVGNMTDVQIEQMRENLDNKLKFHEHLRDSAGFSNMTPQAQQELLNSIEQDKAAIEKFSKYTEDKADYGSWDTQLTDLVNQIDTGEIGLTDEDGLLNLDALRNSSNVMGDWMADTIEKSYDTGIIMGEFFQRDAEGNIVLSDDMQQIESYYNDILDDDMKDQYAEFRRTLARQGLASGQVMGGSAIAEAVTNYQTQVGTQVAEQVTTKLQSEMADQYDYIARALDKAVAAGRENMEEGMFYDQVKLEQEAALAAYEQQMKDLGFQVAETEAARVGDIFNGILSFIGVMAYFL